MLGILWKSCNKPKDCIRVTKGKNVKTVKIARSTVDSPLKLHLRPNPKKNMVYWSLGPYDELTITSPCVHSRVDSNTFPMGNPVPDFIPQSGTLDLASVSRAIEQEKVKKTSFLSSL